MTIKSAALMLPVIDPDPITVIDYDSLTDVPEWEYDAWEDWCFDRGGATNLVGRVNGRSLTLQSAAPGYNADHLVIGTLGNALFTGLADQDAYTLIVVAKYPATSGMLGGTLEGAGGASLLIAGGASSELLSYVPPLTNVQINAATTPTAGDWVAAGLCIASAGSEQRRTLVGLGTYLEVTGEGDYTVTDNQIALGNAFGGVIGAPYTTTPIAMAAATLYDRALTRLEMELAIARAKQRAAHRGLTVL